MSIPSTAYQLAVLLVLVMPGIVYSAVRSRLRGPTPDDREVGARILRAIMVSAVLDSLYLIVVGPRLVKLVDSTDPAEHIREAGVWALILIFVVPAVVAFLVNGLDWDWRNRAIPRVRRQKGYYPTPTAWDFAAPKLGDYFVRIRLSDGRFVGGWLGAKSYLSTYPESRDMYIDRQWRIDHDDGTFLGPVEGTCGVYVPLPRPPALLGDLAGLGPGADQ
jgi:Family of unknown function (DUF6338)